MNAYFRWVVAVGLATTGWLTSTAWGDDGGRQSKLAGAWELVASDSEYLNSLVRESSPWPDSDKGRIYLIIRPDGSFQKAGNGLNEQLCKVRKSGDRLEISGHIFLQVTGSQYSPESSRLILTYHDDRAQEDWTLLYEADLLPDGNIRFREAWPNLDGAYLTVTSTLRRVEDTPPIPSDAMIRDWHLPEGGVVSADLTADGRYVVAASSKENVVHVWEVETGHEVKQLAGHANAISAVAISADGALVASGSKSNAFHDGNADAIRVWDVTTGEQLYQFDAFAEVARLQFTPDGKGLFAAGSGPHNLAFAIWDLETGSLQASSPWKYGVWDAVLSPDGRMVVARMLGDSSDCYLRMFDAGTGTESFCLCDDPWVLRDFAFSPDGLGLLAVNTGGRIREWDIETDEAFPLLDEVSGPFSAAAYLPDGVTLLTASKGNKSISLWDLESGDELLQLVGHRDQVIDLKISSDGQTAVSAGQEGSIRAWLLPPSIEDTDSSD